MSQAQLDRADERRHLKAADAERDREILTRDADAHTANAVAKIRRDQTARQKRFREWDALVESDEFAAFLRDRGYRLEPAYAPPMQADEAEFAALGAMMQTPFALKHGLRELRPPHFRLRDNANALLAIAAVNQKQRQGVRVQVDPTTVALEMRRAGTFTARTADHLIWCINACPSTTNIRAYVRAIVEAAQGRYLFHLGQELARRARAETGGELAPYPNPRHLIHSTRTALDAIEMRGALNLNEVFEHTK